MTSATSIQKHSPRLCSQGLIKEAGESGGPSRVIFNIQRFSLHDGPGIRTTVFLKGCPLRCPWCHNPESQSRLLAHVLGVKVFGVRRLCTGLFKGRVQASGRASRPGFRAVRGMWRLCEEPAAGAGISGRTVTPHEVLAEVLGDTVFYDQSGGGVTFSGGEPLAQPEFLEETLRLCKDAGLSTVVDTCGFAHWDVLERIAPLVDLFLYDVKLMDDAAHMESVGVSNKIILDNLRRLASAGSKVTARLPVIPGVNDGMANIQKTGEYLSSVGVRRVTLLPYHDLGKEKYVRLGREYPLEDMASLPDESIERISHTLRGFGLQVDVSGQS